MSGALVYLFVATRRNALRRFVAGLVRPRRALATLATVGSLVLFAVFGARGASALSPADASGLLVTLLAVTLLLAVSSGLSERGIAFQPAEADFLFPGPFRPRALVAYRAASEALASVVGALLFFVLAGVATANPALALLGSVLCGFTSVHVRLTVALLATQLGDRAFRRLRGPVRALAWVAALALGLLVVSTFTRAGGLRGVLATLIESPVARVALYPATAAGDLSRVTTLAEALPPLAGSLVAVAASLALLLLLQVGFLEASLSATARAAQQRERIRKGARAGPASAAPPARAARGRLPRLRLLRGAGAVAWRNAVAARRSARSLVVSAVLLGIFFVPMSMGRDGPGGGTSALFFGAVLPMILSSTIVFDFRGQADRLHELKALPVSPFGLALAQVSVPSAVALVLQALFVAALVALGRVDPRAGLLAVAAYVPTTTALVAATNLGWFVGARLRVAATIFQLLFLLVLLAALGGAYALLREAGAGLVASVAGLLAVAAAMGLLAVRLLAAAFSAYDPAST